MSARTFTYGGVDHNWTTVGNWDTPPVDNDSVTIASGSVCTYNGDMSNDTTWPNGIAGITVTGTLNFATTGGPYNLKIKAATTIAGAGTLNIGANGAAIPFAVKHIIRGGAGWYINGTSGLTMTVYAAEPAIIFARLNVAASANDTRLYIDTNLTGDIWAIGDTVHIVNINKGKNIEVRTISGIAATYIDISAGLTGTKLVGAYVVLITRNLSIVGNSGTTLQNFAAGKLTITGGAFSATTSGSIVTPASALNISGGTFVCGVAYLLGNTVQILNISGGVFSFDGNSLFATASINISGGIFFGSYISAAGLYIYMTGGIIAGCTGVTNSTTGPIRISGGTITGCGAVVNDGPVYPMTTTISGGIFDRNGSVVATRYVAIVSGGTFSNNTDVFLNCYLSCTGATFTSNTRDIKSCIFTLFNQALTSSPDNSNYNVFDTDAYSESINAGNSGGAFKAWTVGGITTSVASPAPTGYSRSYQIAPVSATIPAWWRRQILVPAGKSVTITTYLYKTASMTYLPVAWIYLDGNQPLDVAGSILHTFHMTNSTTTWETDAYVYSNATDYDQLVDVMFVAENASGYVNTQVKADFGGGTGGSVSIEPSKMAMIG